MEEVKIVKSVKVDANDNDYFELDFLNIKAFAILKVMDFIVRDKLVKNPFAVIKEEFVYN